MIYNYFSIIIFILFNLFFIKSEFDTNEMGNNGFMPNMDQFSDNNQNDNTPKDPNIETINIKDDEIKINEINTEDLNNIEQNKIRHEFQSETNRLMDMFVNFLYTKKDVSIRELISNASDALEKLRHEYIMNKVQHINLDDLNIKIDYDKDNKTISILDNGIGMTKDDLINNLGIMAKSGTINYLENVAKGGDVNLIGQFGVGFYSVFLIADKVTVISKNDNDDQYIWESTADKGYTVVKDPRGNIINRGTRITLKLKDDSLNFLEEKELSKIVKNYSQFINYPIYIKSNRQITEEIDDDIEDNKDENLDENKDENKDENIEEKKPKKKTITKTLNVWERINPLKAIWMRPIDQVSNEEYINFYKSLKNTQNREPLTWIHFKGEGEIEFKSILYIPSVAPNDMFESYFNKNAGIQLYARRVLVAESMDDIVPKYLQFVRGVIDSDDLPLNVSREHLQQSKIIKVISKRIQRKIFDMIKNLQKKRQKEKDEYKEKLENENNKDIDIKLENYKTTFDKFYDNFNKSLKMGCYEDDQNRHKIIKFFRFYTSENTEKPIDFDDFIKSIPKDQKNVYYAAGESIQTLMSNPQMQIFIHKNIPVLLLTEAMDEPCISKLSEYEGKKFESIQKGTIDLPQSNEEIEIEKKMKLKYKNLMNSIKNILKNKILNVEISRRLVDAPCAIVSSKWGHSAYMEKVIKSQTFSDQSQIKYLSTQRVFEINPKHSLIYKLLQLNDNQGENSIKSIVIDMYYGAMLSSGFDLDDPSALGKRIHEILKEKENLTQDIVDIDLSDVNIEEEKNNTNINNNNIENNNKNNDMGLNMDKFKEMGLDMGMDMNKLKDMGLDMDKFKDMGLDMDKFKDMQKNLDNLKNMGLDMNNFDTEKLKNLNMDFNKNKSSEEL